MHGHEGRHARVQRNVANEVVGALSGPFRPEPRPVDRGGDVYAGWKPVLDSDARSLRADEPASAAACDGAGVPRRAGRLHLGLRRGPAAQRASEAVILLAGDGDRARNRRDRDAADAGGVSVGGLGGSLRAGASSR